MKLMNVNMTIFYSRKRRFFTLLVEQDYEKEDDAYNTQMNLKTLNRHF